MKISEVEHAGYVRVGEVDGLDLYAKNFMNGRIRIFQFNTEDQDEHIGMIYITKDILVELLK